MVCVHSAKYSFLYLSFLQQFDNFIEFDHYQCHGLQIGVQCIILLFYYRTAVCRIEKVIPVVEIELLLQEHTIKTMTPQSPCNPENPPPAKRPCHLFSHYKQKAPTQSIIILVFLYSAFDIYYIFSI